MYENLTHYQLIKLLNRQMVSFNFPLLLNSIKKGVEKQLIKAGDNINFPKKGDTVTMH